MNEGKGVERLQNLYALRRFKACHRAKMKLCKRSFLARFAFGPAKMIGGLLRLAMLGPVVGERQMGWTMTRIDEEHGLKPAHCLLVMSRFQGRYSGLVAQRGIARLGLDFF